MVDGFYKIRLARGHALQEDMGIAQTISVWIVILIVLIVLRVGLEIATRVIRDTFWKVRVVRRVVLQGSMVTALNTCAKTVYPNARPATEKQ